MKISGADMMQSIINLQRAGQTGETPFANASIISDSNTDVGKVEISDTGRRIGNMMERVGRMHPPPMREQMNEMKSSIAELNLSELDLDNMTDEEIDEIAAQIHEVMESFKPENISGGIDLSSMSAEEKRSFVTEFKNNAEGVLQSVGKMEGMLQGKPPMGGRPPAGGKPQMGGNGQNTIEAYESSNVSNDEDEQLSMIESLLEALESDENNSDTTDMSEFYKVIGDYLSINMN